MLYIYSLSFLFTSAAICYCVPIIGDTGYARHFVLTYNYGGIQGKLD